LKIFFSHPTVTFRTDTEEACFEKLRNKFEGIDKIINPADYGLKHDTKKLIKRSDVIVGMAISERYTFLVWNEMLKGKEHDAELYTIRVYDKDNIEEIEKGMPEDIIRLNKKESEKFTNELMKENRESFLSLLIGKHNTRF